MDTDFEILNGAMNGRPVPILRPKGQSLILDTETLFDVLAKIGACHFAIYSINGPKGTGKSFLLDKFLYCLENPDDKDWFTNSLKSKDVFYGNRELEIRGGIRIWSEPIFVKHEEKRIAILLMDCAFGGFQVEDREMALKDDFHVLAWSWLLSSVFVYSAMRGFDLENLQSFQAVQEYLHYQQTTNGERLGTEKKHLQSILLIRDWCLGDHDFGYYSKMIYAKQIKDIILKYSEKVTYKTAEKSFEDTSVYLLPHPGNSFAMYGKKDCFDALFLKYAEQFVQTMRQQLHLKSANTEQLITGDEFIDNIKYWNDILTNNTLPLIGKRESSRNLIQLSLKNNLDNHSAELAKSKLQDPQDSCLRDQKPEKYSISNAGSNNGHAESMQPVVNGKDIEVNVKPGSSQNAYSAGRNLIEDSTNEFGNDFVVNAEERQILEDWISSGSLIFLKIFKKMIKKEFRTKNREDHKYQKASVASRVVGIGVGALVSPFIPNAIPFSKVLFGAAFEKVGNLVLGKIDDDKRNNLFTWTDTLDKKAEKAFDITITTAMCYICIAYKDLLTTIAANDNNKINFFIDAIRRIFNYLSENKSDGKKLSSEKVFEAFLKGRSISHSLSTTRGLIIDSSNKRLNTREIFEEGIFVSKTEGTVELYIRKEVDDKKPINLTECRFVYKFENKGELLNAYKKIEVPNNTAQLQGDFRFIPNAIEDFIQEILAQKSDTTDSKKCCDLDKENNEMLKRLCKTINLMADKLGNENGENSRGNMPEKLIQKWWPEKKLLVNAFYERKENGKLLAEHIMELLQSVKNKMLVITQKSHLSGLGGVGKTITAKWFANNYDEDYEHVIWIDSGEDNLLKSFKDLARDLKIDYRHELDLKNLARKCFERLWDCKCLWIFDNAECYQGEHGIKDLLPINYANFHCLITSRNLEWGNRNGLGITDFQLDVFGNDESYEFVKNALNVDIQYKVSQLKTLCNMLGNLPLALQLSVATLNNGKLDVNAMISKVDCPGTIVKKKFDDYENTIDKNMQISLDLIQKEPKGKIALDLLSIFGYIRPDDVDTEFLRRASSIKQTDLTDAVDLLVKYSLVTKTGRQTINLDSSFWNKMLFQTPSVEVDLLSIHRLLQQTIRHNGKDTERKVIRKILHCEGFLEYKRIPFRYADEKLKREFNKVKAELIDPLQLETLIASGNFEKAVDLAKFISEEAKSPTALFNYAFCLEKFGERKDALDILTELLTELKIKDKSENIFAAETTCDTMDLNEKLTKSRVWHQIIFIHINQLNKAFTAGCFAEALQAAEFLNKEIQSPTSAFNYASCLETCGNIEESLSVLKKVYSQVYKPTTLVFRNDVQSSLLDLNWTVDKLMVKTQIFFMHIKTLEYEKATEVFEDISEFLKFRKDKVNTDVTYLVKILNQSDIMGYSFTFSYDRATLKFNETTKSIELWDCCVALKVLPTGLHHLILHRVSFLDQIGKALHICKLASDIIGPNMQHLQLNCSTRVIISLEDMTSLRSLHLNCCTILVDKIVKRITLRELGLQCVTFFITNTSSQWAADILLHEFFDFMEIRKLKLSGSNGKINLIYDINQVATKYESKILNQPVSNLVLKIEHIPYVEYLHLNKITLILLNGFKIVPKELKIEDISFLSRYGPITDVCLNEFVDLKEINKLSISDEDMLIDPSDEIYVDTVILTAPRLLKAENAKWNVNKFSLCNSNMTTPNLRMIKELELCGSWNNAVEIDLSVIPDSVEKLTLGEGTEVKSSLKTFKLGKLKYLSIKNRNSKCLILFSQCESLVKIQFQCKTKDDLSAVVKYLKKPFKTVALGIFVWKTDLQFENSAFAKLVNVQAQYYFFQNSKGIAIHEQEFKNK